MFDGLSYGEIVRLMQRSQGLGLRGSQREAPQLLCKILPSFTKMCTLRSELPLLEGQRGPPNDLTKTDKSEKDLGLI